MKITKELTIEELKAKRKEIDAQIKALRDGNTVVCEMARFEKQTYSTARPNEWCVFLKRILKKDHGTPGINSSNRESWFSIIRCVEKEAAIDSIPLMISGLQELYDTLKEKTEGEE